MTEKQLDELFPEMTLNTNPRVRKKCLVVYLRKTGYRREVVAELLRIDEDTVTHYTKKYDESGLPGLVEENYHQPKSHLEPYTEQLKELFKKQAPHTVNQAIEMIDKETGIRLQLSAGKAFLKKMGMKCRRCGVVPGKAMDADKQRQAQQQFHDQQLQPALHEAKQGKRTVPFCSSMRRTS
jgi:transposase